MKYRLRFCGSHPKTTRLALSPKKSFFWFGRKKGEKMIAIAATLFVLGAAPSPSPSPGDAISYQSYSYNEQTTSPPLPLPPPPSPPPSPSSPPPSSPTLWSGDDALVEHGGEFCRNSTFHPKPESTISVCQAACAAEPWCTAFSRDERGLCFLCSDCTPEYCGFLYFKPDEAGPSDPPLPSPPPSPLIPSSSPPPSPPPTSRSPFPPPSPPG